MFKRLAKYALFRVGGAFGNLHQRSALDDDLRILCAKVILSQRRGERFSNIQGAEFKVFSQWGEDGILQYLVEMVNATHTFIEFGVENYVESNTRFLLQNNGWEGLVIDGSQSNVLAIKASEYYWRSNLNATCSFITVDNINILLALVGFKETGILSIDIDGNDYWIWKAISGTHAEIVVIEYNSIFGADRAVSVPYVPMFSRTEAHYSNLYYGASLAALGHLAHEKGYALVGCNSAGNNAFFVRRDKLGGLPSLTVNEAFVTSRFRESRDEKGRLSFISGAERLGVIAELPLVDVLSGARLSVGDLQ